MYLGSRYHWLNKVPLVVVRVVAIIVGVDVWDKKTRLVCAYESL